MSAYQNYHLYTEPDGTIKGHTATNDNQDLGYPTEYADWEVNYHSHGDMLKRTGGTHYGCSGIHVRVFLDGKEVVCQPR